MDRWFQWIKKYKYIFSILLLILIIGIPMLIHYIFCIPAPLLWLEARWEPGSVLEYYGSVLGFLGTVSLSMLALYQNQEIKKESDKRERIL